MNIWSYSISITLGTPSSVLRSRSASWLPVSKAPMDNFPLENTCMCPKCLLYGSKFSPYFTSLSLRFLFFRISLLLLFHSVVVFYPSLLSPYSPALARQTSSLTFFFLPMLFLFPHVRGILLFIFVFVLFCLSFTQYFEYLSPYDTLFYNCLTPRANSGGGDSRQWQKSDLSAALTPIIASPLKKNSCYYPPYMFPKSVSPFTILSFICVKYFPIVVMYFPDIADPEGQL